MNKFLLFTLAVLMVFAVTACGTTEAPGTEADRPEQSSNAFAPSEVAKPSGEQEPEGIGPKSETDLASGGSNVLIAYFTWAENTVVENPDEVDVDAITSASVLPPGNTAKLAGWIQEATGGDLFSIITAEPYSSDYDECLDQAIEEHDADARPALTGRVKNIDDYNVVFLGYPNWWYSCPMAVLTFIEENDLSGKTIVPFCAHGTGGLAGSVRDFTAVLPDDCTVLEAFGSYRPAVDSAQPEINEWLARLGIKY
ncbi:MAG: flavodoxin [Peptococcaceae bacterium]